MPTDAGLCQGEGLALGKGQMPRPWDVDFGSSLRETLNLQKKNVHLDFQLAQAQRITEET